MRLAGGLLALVLVVTGLVARGAPADAAITASWPIGRFDAARTGFNQNETGISAANAVGLHEERVFRFDPDPIDTLHRPPTLVLNGVVFYAEQVAGCVVARSLATGTKLFRKCFTDLAGVSIVLATSTKDVVYVGAQFTVRALDAGTGGLLWTGTTSQLLGPYSTPLVTTDLVVFPTFRGISAFKNQRSCPQCAPVWESFNVGALASSPARVGSTILFTAATTLWALDADNGGYIWSGTLNCGAGDGPNGPAISGRNVYVVDGCGFLYAFDLLSGEQLFSPRVVIPSSGTNPCHSVGVQSSPAVANGRVIVAGIGGIVAVSAATGTELWHHCYADENQQSGAAPLSSPTVANGLVFVGRAPINFYPDHGTLDVLRLSNGQYLARRSPHAPDLLHPHLSDVFSEPVVVNGHVYVETNDGAIHEFGP